MNFASAMNRCLVASGICTPGTLAITWFAEKMVR